MSSFSENETGFPGLHLIPWNEADKRTLPEGIFQSMSHLTPAQLVQKVWDDQWAEEDAKRKAEDEAREAALTPQERQFRGFGHLVWQELSKTIDTLNENSEDFDGCIVCNWSEDDLLKFFSPVISRCAYAFAKHVIDHVDYVELEMSFDREELVMTMPDLDAWPEETSNSKEQ